MAFHFPLVGVLRFRKSIEHQEELRLLAANQAVAQVRQRIAEMDRGMELSLARETRLLQAGLSAAEIQFELLCRANLRHRRRELVQELVRKEEIRNQQRAVFQQARKAREIVDTLREHQFQLFRQQQARREQRRLDDLFLLRREHRRG